MKKILDIYRRYGICGIIEKTLLKLFSITFLDIDKRLCFKKNLNTSLDCIYEYKILSLKDFYIQKNVNPDWFSEKKISDIEKAFLIDGNMPYGIYDKNLLIAYGWISTKYFGLEMRNLQHNDGFLWDDYTHPKYRGKGLHRAIILIRQNELLKLGKNRALTFISSYNKASMSAYKKIGYTVMETFYLISYRHSQIKTTLKYENI